MTDGEQRASDEGINDTLSPQEMEKLERAAKRVAKKRERLEKSLADVGILVPPQQQSMVRMQLLLDVCLPPGTLDRAQFDLLCEETWCELLEEILSKKTQERIQAGQGSGALVVPAPGLVVPR